MANKPYGILYNFNQNVSITPKDIYNLYPIGSIYMSVVNINPSEYFGGTWERFGEGRTIVSVDSSQSDFNTSMKIGGEKAHVLTINEMPSHNHNIIRSDGGVANELGWGSNQWDTGYISTSGTNKKNASQRITHTGGSQAHNNMPPYITVYMWRRVL